MKQNLNKKEENHSITAFYLDMSKKSSNSARLSCKSIKTEIHEKTNSSGSGIAALSISSSLFDSNESLPDWLTVDQSFGSIAPMQDKAVRFYYNTDMPVGEYMDLVYLTIYGNEEMTDRTLTFLLWQASTGKTYTLTSSVDIRFKAGTVIGCGQDEPILFSTGASETQSIPLNAGWNWVSFNLNLRPGEGTSSVVWDKVMWISTSTIRLPKCPSVVLYSLLTKVRRKFIAMLPT